MLKVFRAKDKDLGLSKNKYLSHDVLLVSRNKKTNYCYVKTVSSLEKEKNGKLRFKLDKLDEIRKGEIIVIPKNQINTQVLSGVYYKPIRIHYSKLYKSKTGVIAPKKYKKVLK